MYRVSINKSTGKVIEMQSGGYEDVALRETRLNTLRQNALNAGYKKDEIEVKWATEEEWALLMEPTAEEKEAIEKEKLIQTEMNTILRELAIERLKKAGKLKFL